MITIQDAYSSNSTKYLPIVKTIKVCDMVHIRVHRYILIIVMIQKTRDYNTQSLIQFAFIIKNSQIVLLLLLIIHNELLLLLVYTEK